MLSEDLWYFAKYICKILLSNSYRCDEYIMTCPYDLNFKILM